MKLPECDRASLASRLLDSLPAVLSDGDGGVAEALCRNAELEQDPVAVVTKVRPLRPGPGSDSTPARSCQAKLMLSRSPLSPAL